MAVILAEAASVEEAAAQGSRLLPRVAPKAFRATYRLVILRLFYSDAFYTLYFSEKKRSRVEEAIFMAEEKALVGIIMGSESDMPNMEPCMKQLEEFGIPYEVKVASAHRKPAEVHEWASGAEGRGMRVIVAAAGKAAHLGGVVAALYSAAGYCRAYENERLGWSRFASLYGPNALWCARRMRRHQWREKRCDSRGANARHGLR